MKNSVKQANYFNRYRKLAILAFVCAILLTVFILGMALIPGNVSKQISDFVKGIVKNIFNVDETIVPTYVSFSVNSNKYVFTDDVVSVKLNVRPSGADKQVDYKFLEHGEGQFVVNDNGEVVYVGSKFDYYLMEVTSVLNPSATYSGTILARGLSPVDERIEKLYLKFLYKSKSVDLHQLEVGKTYDVRLTAVIKEEYRQSLGANSKGEIDMRVPYDLTINGSTQGFYYETYNRKFRLTDPITNGEIHFRFADSKTTYFDQQEKYGEVCNYSTTISGVVNPANDYVPTKPLIPSVDNGTTTANPDGSYTFNLYERTSGYTVRATTTEDASADFYIVMEDANQTNVTINGINFHRQTNGFTEVMYVVSMLDESVKTKIYVVQPPVIPTKLTIAHLQQVAVTSGKVSLSAHFDKTLFSDKQINWQIVSAPKGTTISQNGVVMFSRMGNITVRATSESFPELQDQVTFKVSVWGNFSSFVRKYIGHFLCFVALGLCTSCACYLLLNNKKHAFVVTPTTTFAIAGLSKIFQLPLFTSGRYALFFDVILDFVGAMLGMAIFALILYTVIFIWKKRCPQTFAQFQTQLRKLNFTTVFKKSHPVVVEQLQQQDGDGNRQN